MRVAHTSARGVMEANPAGSKRAGTGGMAMRRRAAFGLDAGARGRMHFIDDGSVAYVAGKLVVVYDFATGTQRFLPIAKDVREVSAMCAHASSSMIAVAVLDDGGECSIAMYDSQTFKKKRTLTRAMDSKPHVGVNASGGVGDRVSLDGLTFSEDGRSILGYSTTSHALVCWNVVDGSAVELPSPRRVVSTVAGEHSSAQRVSDPTLQIKHASFSPHEPGVISAVCAGGVFRMYRANETTVKPLMVKALNTLVKDEGRDATTHLWLKGDDKHVAIGTSTGQVIVLEGDEIVCELNVHRGGGETSNALPASDLDARTRVNCVESYKNGFITAGSSGDVVIVDRVPKKQVKNGRAYKCVKTLAARASADEDLYDTSTSGVPAIMDGDQVKGYEPALLEPQVARSVVAMSISPSSDNVICTLDNKHVLALSLTNADIMQANEMRFKRVLPDAHLNGVSSLDICRRRRIMVSVSATDKSMRLWNLTSNECEVLKEFLDNPLCVSIHPSGWIACVGFSDKLRLMHILNGDFRVVREFALKACRVVEFSKGGHLVASAVGATIYVYHVFTFESIAVLRGHCGKVKSVVWDNNDATLISSGADGAIYEWDVRAASKDDEKARRREHVHKGSAYTSITVVRQTGGIIACSSDAKLKELDDEFKVVREFSSGGVALTHVAYSASLHQLFASTANGGVRVYKIPLTGEYVEFTGHGKPITSLKLSYDETTLHSAGDDGCLFTYDVKPDAAERSAGEIAPRMASKDDVLSSDEVLIARCDLDELNQRIVELQNQVKEISLQSQYQLRLKTAEMNEKVKSTEDEATRLLEYEKQRVSALERERDAIVRDTKRELERTIDDHEKRLTEAEDDYTSKMFTEVRRFDDLKMQSDAAKAEWEQLETKLVDEHEKEIESMKGVFNARIATLKSDIDGLQKDRELMLEDFERARSVMDTEVDAEIEELKATYEARVRREHDSCLVLRGENGVTKTKYAVVKQNEDARLQEIETLRAEKATMAETIAALEAEAGSLHDTIDSHERAIETKNKNLVRANAKFARAEKQVAELAKVADDLREQQRPLEERVRARESDFEAMNEELLRYYNSNSALVRQVRDVKSQREALQRDVLRTRKQSADSAAVVKRFQRDLHECANNIQDAKLLKESVKAMYHKYINTDEAFEAWRDEACEMEAKRQRDHLEKTIAALRRQVKAEADSRRVEFHRVMRENQNLMREVDACRAEKAQ